MEHTLTITVDESVYEKMKPFIEQQTFNTFISNAIVTYQQSLPSAHPGIAGMRGSLHQVDISDIREEDDREI